MELVDMPGSNPGELTTCAGSSPVLATYSGSAAEGDRSVAVNHVSLTRRFESVRSHFELVIMAAQCYLTTTT